jgi:hypothetical protein
MHASYSRKHIWSAALCGLVLLAAAVPAAAQGKNDAKTHEFNLSIGASKTADAKDVGLPIYPGARPHKDNADDESAARVWALLGDAGFRLAVVKLESRDPPGRIAPFYRQALARYGNVVDCSAASVKARSNGKNSSWQLDCDDDHGKPGELVLKAGTKNDRHVVGIKPNGSGSVIDLVHVQVRGFGE